MRGRVLAAFAAVVVAGGCADDFGERSRASVEAELLEQARSVAGLAGVAVTDWRAETSPCDIASPGRLWGMVTRSKLAVPRDRQVAVLHTVRDQWDREQREFGDRRIAPDRSLPEGETGHLQAAAAFGNASVIGSADADSLDVIVSSKCYDAVKGENPGKG